jgi:2-polyprenyl-3-methyl-5-hydroxy-6-metoxy-1,4-benzoquinol methylase
MRALFALSEAQSVPPSGVFEVAAGDGALCACLAKEGCEVFANDLRAGNIRDSVQHFTNPEAINILPGNLFELDPTSVGLFDLVIACALVEHVLNRQPSCFPMPSNNGFVRRCRWYSLCSHSYSEIHLAT